MPLLRLLNALEERSRVRSPAVRQLEALANSGDIEAQYALGNGWGGIGPQFPPFTGISNASRVSDLVEEARAERVYPFNSSTEKAIYWFEKAAIAGHAKAQHCLALKLQDGPRSHEVIDWLDKAAKQRHPPALSALGRELLRKSNPSADEITKGIESLISADRLYCSNNFIIHNPLYQVYSTGKLVPMDRVKAAHWLEKAATAGDSISQRRLGLAYANGTGVEKNMELAEHWLRKASDHGDRDAADKIIELFGSISKAKPSPRNTTVDPNAFRPENLTHMTAKGEYVRSKSEVIIANTLYYLGIAYEYEQHLKGLDGTSKIPDFTIRSRSGAPLVWEHLGLMQRRDYRQNWDRKLSWYKNNGFVEGETLFVTQDDTDGNVDSKEIHDLAVQIRSMTENPSS